MKPVKKAVALVIHNEARDHVLSVLRPSDDEHLPNLWGLPAGTLGKGESFEEAVIRSGKEKLGVELKVVGLVGEGELERENYILRMKEFEARVLEGEPVVPQALGGVTQYRKWSWSVGDELVEAARAGSLCSRIYLRSIGREW